MILPVCEYILSDSMTPGKIVLNRSCSHQSCTLSRASLLRMPLTRSTRSLPLPLHTIHSVLTAAFLASTLECDFGSLSPIQYPFSHSFVLWPPLLWECVVSGNTGACHFVPTITSVCVVLELAHSVGH